MLGLRLLAVGWEIWRVMTDGWWHTSSADESLSNFGGGRKRPFYASLESEKRARHQPNLRLVVGETRLQDAPLQLAISAIRSMAFGDWADTATLGSC